MNLINKNFLEKSKSILRGMPTCFRIMQLGFKRPLTDKDVLKLDTWDRTETLNNRFQQCWAEESHLPKPWLLRALNNSLGRRFWWGGIWKIGNDSSQFVGPLILNQFL